MAQSDTKFPWPPKDQSPEKGHMKFFRSSYDLEIATLTREEIVTIVVGDVETSTFCLPKCALQSTSDFFARALKPEWSTCSPRIIRLHDVNAALFDLYARWVASGAEVMIDEDDWKAEYAEYLKWRRELEDDKEQWREDKKAKSLCPVTVWDFELTTAAWFLGDFLQSHAFQNHCLGHLYYMHLRFDHFGIKDESFWDDKSNSAWHWGTFAYIRAENVLYTWKVTKHLHDRTLFRLEQHPLRKFFVDWLNQYWYAYEVGDFDYETQDGIAKLIKNCPDIVYKQLTCSSPAPYASTWFVQGICEYWV